MLTPWRYIDVETRGDLCCLRLRQTRFEEQQVDELANEIVAAGTAEDCTRVALSLGPRPPECLYSVFLAKLISVQRRLREKGCQLLLCEASTEVLAIFSACKLTEHFAFAADFNAAAQTAAVHAN